MLSRNGPDGLKTVSNHECSMTDFPQAHLCVCKDSHTPGHAFDVFSLQKSPSSLRVHEAMHVGRIGSCNLT